MICPTCHGQGSQPPATTLAQDRGRTFYPCLECEGSGILHCCEGLREQPEPLPRQRAAGSEVGAKDRD